MSKAVVDCLEDWGVKDRVVSLSFDTTSSNTGVISGACTLIEAALGRDLLHLACRHHILELVAEKAFTASDCVPSTGPDILLFERFKQHWKFIDRSNFRVFEEEVRERDELVLFFKHKLHVDQPRDDYRELLELSIIYLGDVPPRGIGFMQPGALHRARWMARVIYAIQICLFQTQFKTSKREWSGLIDLQPLRLPSMSVHGFRPLMWLQLLPMILGYCSSLHPTQTLPWQKLLVLVSPSTSGT
jgi:hypothetical protein